MFQIKQFGSVSKAEPVASCAASKPIQAVVAYYARNEEVEQTKILEHILCEIGDYIARDMVKANSY